MNAYKNASYVGFVIFIFGIIITVYGFSFLMDDMDLQYNGILVTGRVVDINKKDFYRSPFVRFRTKSGRSITFLSKLDVNVDLFKYKIGQKVEVIYHKDNPKNAEVNAFWERNAGQIYLGSLGLFLLLLGWFIRRTLLKKAAAYENA